jgi:sugar O-acyltransferase (sialic acid O-acetyltransferase NeuD family)
MKQVIIIGASGFGGEVAWVLERMAEPTGGAAIIGFCDDAPGKQCGVWRGRPLLGPVGATACVAGAACGEVWFHVAVGGNAARERLTARAIACGWRPLTVYDPTAVVAADACVGEGCYIGAGVVISCGSRLGAGVIVNHQATVGHDAVVDAFAQICPGARVSGGCHIGARALLGSNAVVIPGVSIGADATVGATAAALRDVPDGGGVARAGR